MLYERVYLFFGERLVTSAKSLGLQVGVTTATPKEAVVVAMTATKQNFRPKFHRTHDTPRKRVSPARQN